MIPGNVPIDGFFQQQSCILVLLQQYSMAWTPISVSPRPGQGFISTHSHHQSGNIFLYSALVFSQASWQLAHHQCGRGPFLQGLPLLGPGEGTGIGIGLGFGVGFGVGMGPGSGVGPGTGGSGVIGDIAPPQAKHNPAASVQ